MGRYDRRHGAKKSREKKEEIKNKNEAKIEEIKKRDSDASENRSETGSEPGNESDEKKEDLLDGLSVKSSLTSMAFSLVLVGISLAFVFGFKAFLDHQTYDPSAQATVMGISDTKKTNSHKEYLNTDKNFKTSFLMVKGVPAAGLYADNVPGKKEEDSEKVESGQILKAVKKGSYNQKTYYHLNNGKYLEADDARVEILKSYSKLDGYLAITYISSTGVHLRYWADFETNNVVKNVYVGDKVPIVAKVETASGDSAYITSEGYYITTDNQYFNDYTMNVESTEESEKTTQTAEK